MTGSNLHDDLSESGSRQDRTSHGATTGTDVHDDVLDELRRANLVDGDALASASDPGPARTLDAILSGVDPRSAPRRRRHRNDTAIVRNHGRRWIPATAAAALIALVATATVVAYDTGTGLDATAAVHDAAATTIRASESAHFATTITFDPEDFDDSWELAFSGTLVDGDSEITWHPSPGVPGTVIPPMEGVTSVIIDNMEYRSTDGGPWQGPFPAADSALQSNLTFGVAIDDLGAFYDFESVGDENLDEVRVARYRTSSTPVGAGAGLKLLLGTGLTAVGAEIPERLDDVQLDVWVDDADLIRRVSYAVRIDGAGTFVVVTDWSGFGEAPPITSPLPSEQ